ncbi:MAG: DUF4037 domain-containing protein, partial [Phycisphaerae bacterium]|nr:DUF4037 domain-containing protein [Phycisphaerae bacterium]
TSVEFIAGLELSERYYFEVVKPILSKFFPDLKYSSGLIGSGSEVLGFDDEMSRDHHWGPRLILFLTDTDYTNLSSSIDRSLRQSLPATCHGYPTNFSRPDNNGVRLMEPNLSGEINHFIEIVAIKEYFNNFLGIDIYNKLNNIDWLSFPQQILLSIQSGRIFHDQLGLNDIRGRLNYYPHDIWLYIIASSWQRIGQEEHLAARAWLAGQDIGFSIITSRLVRDIMQLGFLMERKYAPFAKWLEKSFIKLNCSKALMPYLGKIIESNSSKTKQEDLYRAFETLASIHNDLSITKPINSECREWHNRPFRAIHGGQVAEIIADSIEDIEMRSIVRKGLIGNIDQISDNTEVLENRLLRRKLIQSVFG